MSCSGGKSSAPYGSWKSPITADIVSGSDKRLEGFTVDSHGHLIWLETRPAQSGRAVLVKESPKPGEPPQDITPTDFNVRTTVHEYGGAAFGVYGDVLVFSNFDDQRLYKQLLHSPDSGPVPITPDYGGPVVRYADGVFDGRFNRYIAVREDHREFDAKPTTEIVSIALNGKTTEEPKVLISGNDFYAFPRMDMKGERLAWIEWSHPNMHWDKAELWVGYRSESGDIDKRVLVAGGCPTIVESPTEPLWSSKGRISSEILLSQDHFWVFGNRCYDIIERKEESAIIACSYRQHGKSYLGVINQAKNSFCSVDIPFTYISNILASGQILYIEGASSVLPTSLAKVILDDHMSDVVEVSIMWSSSSDIDKYISYFSLPELIEFPTDVAGQNAYAYFYPPCNPEYNGSQEEKPPLLLESHGGPTGEAYGTLSLSIQYWTSRGWAFVDVNYGGSTGYGRAYRERLLGKWGIVDINDCCSCAKYLVDEGKVDGKRLCITGCSAGGYTTLASLAFRDTFRAGASLFGIADLKSLSDSMHKFESHYIINLGGNEIALNERSPINFVDRFSCPIILFQGLEDTVVQPEQARKIYHTLKEKGLPVALVEYEGESHGFRKAESIKYTLEQQMVFFARTVGHFAVAEDITPTHIDNFDQVLPVS
ncbi:hypothetical protein P3S68_030273 [Capsicum galapagoense]